MPAWMLVYALIRVKYPWYGTSETEREVQQKKNITPVWHKWYAKITKTFNSWSKKNLHIDVIKCLPAILLTGFWSSAGMGKSRSDLSLRTWDEVLLSLLWFSSVRSLAHNWRSVTWWYSSPFLTNSSDWSLSILIFEHPSRRAVNWKRKGNSQARFSFGGVGSG